MLLDLIELKINRLHGGSTRRSRVRDPAAAFLFGFFKFARRCECTWVDLAQRQLHCMNSSTVLFCQQFGENRH